MSKQKRWFVTYMYGENGAVMVCNTSQLNKLKKMLNPIQVIEIENSNQFSYYVNLIKYTLNQIDQTGKVRELMVSPIQFEERADGRVRLVHSDVPIYLKDYFRKS